MSTKAKQLTAIPPPPVTRQRLEAIIAQQQALQGQIEAILWTARDLLHVPPDYQLTNTAVGFEPPAVVDQPPA